MKTRVVVTLLLLVVLPTAWLGILAGRALKNWELVIQRGLQTTAENTLRILSNQIRARLEEEVVRVGAALSDSVAHGGKFEEIAGTAGRLTESRALIGNVYLFMNPWGFVYPDFSEKSPPYLADLTAALRNAILAAGPDQEVGFLVRGEVYRFAPVSGKMGLYAGYALDTAEFAAYLKRAMTAQEGGGLALRAESSDRPEFAAGRIMEDVVISDPLGGRSAASEAHESGGRAGARLAEKFLAPPLDFVRVSAWVEDPESIQRASRFKYRLHAWGIFLLIAGIGTGVLLVLREAAEEIRRVRARSEFVIGVSHDLRTPVASMKILTESLYLDRVPDPAKRKKFLGALVRECGRLEQLIERVLFFVRLGQNALVYRPIETDPGRLVSSAVQVFLSRFEDLSMSEGAGPPVDLRIPENLPAVCADEAALVQVILNLLDNAAKYGKKDEKAGGCPPIHVILEICSCPLAGKPSPFSTASRRGWPFGRKRNWLRISIRDEGAGISEGERKRVFRRFYRAPAARKSHSSGVGLGLSLCKHVVESHGGWLAVESVPGQGSTFSVFLPVVQDPAG